MSDIGLEGAYGGIGMSDALNQAQNLRLKLWQMGEQQRLANAELGQKQQGLDEVHADRLARIQDQQATAAQAAADREDAQKLRSLNLATTMIPPNTTLPQGEGQRLLNLGLTPDRLKTTPAQPASLPGVTQTAGLIPLNRTDASAQTTTTPAPTPATPETQTYLGTNAQLEKQAGDTRAITAESDKVAGQKAALDVQQQLADIRQQVANTPKLTHDPVPHFVAQDRILDGKPVAGVMNTLTGAWNAHPEQGSLHAPAGAAQAASSAAETQKTLGALDQVDQALTAAKDLVGPGAGRVSTVEQMIGSQDPRINALGAKTLMAKLLVDKALTGSARAGASPTLLARWDTLLTQQQTPENMRATVQAMREILKGSEAGPAAATSPKRIVYGMDGKPIG